MTTAAQFGGGRGYKASVIGAVSRVAGITLTEGCRLVSVLGSKLLDQVLVTCITEVGGFVRQFRQLTDLESADVNLDHSSGNEFGALPAVRVMTARAISPGRRAMHKFFVQVQTIVVMA